MSRQNAACASPRAEDRRRFLRGEGRSFRLGTGIIKALRLRGGRQIAGGAFYSVYLGAARAKFPRRLPPVSARPLRGSFPSKPRRRQWRAPGKFQRAILLPEIPELRRACRNFPPHGVAGSARLSCALKNFGVAPRRANSGKNRISAFRARRIPAARG